MISETELTKLKTTLLALRIHELRAYESCNNFVSLLGRYLLPFAESSVVANYLYDMVNLLDEVCTNATPKKILNNIRVLQKKASKAIAPKEFSQFLANWISQCPTNNETQSFEALLEVFIGVFAITFQAVYVGKQGLCLKDFACADIYSWRLFKNSYGILMDNRNCGKPDPLFSQAFQTFLESQLYSKKAEYHLEILKALMRQFGNNSFWDMFGGVKTIGSITEKRLPALIKAYPAHAKVLEEQYRRMEESFKNNPYIWSRNEILLAGMLTGNLLSLRFDYIEKAAWKNAAIYTYLPFMVDSPPWLDNNLFEPNDDFLNQFCSITAECCAMDILRRRKFYIQKNGVRLSFEVPLMSSICVMVISEIHQNGLHYIWLSAKIEKAGHQIFRHLMLPIDDVLQGIRFFICKEDVYLFLFLIHWLGLSEDWEHIKDDHFDTLEGVKFCAYLMQLSEIIKKWCNNSDIKYCPVATKKILTQEPQKSDAEPISYLLEKKEIGNFIRRLPLGQQASVEAIEHARKFHIDLPAGYTFVTGFTRMQPIKISSTSE